jgi:riboflavin-specific deaminase-like protein
VIGLGTLLRDDPLLTVRSSFDRRIPGNRMCRIVLDSRLRCPEKAAVFNHQDPENTIVATTSRSAAAKQKALLDKGIRVWILPADSDGRVSVRRLVEKTAAEGILSLLVEGGTGVFTSFLGGGYADRLVVFLAPLLMGNGKDAFGEMVRRVQGKTASLKTESWKRLGPDIFFCGSLPCSPG